MKKNVISVAVLLCLLMLSIAYADGIQWTCPNCGKTENTGRFCGNCGQAAPGRVFYLHDYLIMDRGRVTITWTDTENRQPYTVVYKYEDDSNVQEMTLAATGITSNWFTFDTLIPGKSYWICVVDADMQLIDQYYDLPEPKEFADGELTSSSVRAWVNPVRKESSDEWANATILAKVKAADIINDKGTYDYCLGYTFEHDILPEPREYFSQSVIYAPNGYVASVAGYDLTFGIDPSNSQTYIDPDLFEKVYQQTGTIPAGKWTFELYWNGMFVNRFIYYMPQ